MKLSKTMAIALKRVPLIFKSGQFTFAVVYLFDHDLRLLQNVLELKKKQAPIFLKGVLIANASGLSDVLDWKAFRRMLEGLGCELIGVSGCETDRQEAAIRSAGLSLLQEGSLSAQTRELAGNDRVDAEPLYIDRPVRSGQRIHAKGRSLIITASVGAGAEVIADGNIHIYGSLRGRALAGAGGETRSQIFITNLQAELLSIAGVYWLSEQIDPGFWRQPATIRCDENRLVIKRLELSA